MPIDGRSSHHHHINAHTDTGVARGIDEAHYRFATIHGSRHRAVRVPILKGAAPSGRRRGGGWQ